MRLVRYVMIAVLMSALLLSGIPSASSQSAVITGICNQITYAPTATLPAGAAHPALQHLSSLSSLILISLLIMLLMLALSGMLYGIGYALGFHTLVRFAKAEIGEVVLTVLIIAFLIGAASFTNKLVSTGTFFSDCNTLGQFSVGLVPFITIYTLTSTAVQLASNTQIQIGTSYNGGFVSPLIGYGIVNSQLTILIEMATAMSVLLLGVIVILGIIYYLFPIFLYAGIVLRTIPWTRAAGGSFLGLFIGFYILFPFLLHVMLSYAPSIPVTTPIDTSFVVCQSVTTCFADPSSFVKTTVNLITGFIEKGFVPTFITAVLAPSIYIIIAVLLSLYISLEIVEMMSSLLGAPSLRAHGTIRRLV